MNYLPFKVKGGPELHTALKNLPAPYRNGWVGDSPYCYYKFNIIDLRLEQGDCNEIEISPEEFVSKVNNFIKASAFACKGSPELAQLLDTYHKAGLKDFQNDPCISPNKCYFIWENQLFSRPCSEPVSIEMFRAYWDSKFGISCKSLTTINKNKIFIRSSKEASEILSDLLCRGILHTTLEENILSKPDVSFAIGSVTEGEITCTASKEYYPNKGFNEVTPQQLKELWDIEEKSTKPTVIDKNKTFIRGGKETKEVLCTLLNLGLFETVLNVNDFSEEDRYFALGSMREGKLTYTSDRNFYIRNGLAEITPSEVRALWLRKELTPLKASSAHINMESPKNSKPFGLSQKQTLKIVL